jgi:hypothetical protein
VRLRRNKPPCLIGDLAYRLGLEQLERTGRRPHTGNVRLRRNKPPCLIGDLAYRLGLEQLERTGRHPTPETYGYAATSHRV